MTCTLLLVVILAIMQSIAQEPERSIRAVNQSEDASQNTVCNKFANCPLLPGECETRGKKTLYIMAMAPYPVPESEGPPPSWLGGPEVIPGALLAACHINCDSTILPDYTIELVITDGGCNTSTRASSNFVNEFFFSQEKERHIVGVIGGSCSESSFTVGSLVSQDRTSLIQIAPSATSPVFVSEIQNYQNTFRLTVSARGYIDAFQSLIKLKGYEEVAILYEANRSYMVNVYNHFAQALREKGVKADKTFGLLSSYLEEPLMELEKKVRFIFVLAGGDFAKKILCLAYRKNMLNPHYQFIFINRRPKTFLKNVKIMRDGEDKPDCSPSDMDVALSAAVLFEFRVTREDKYTKTVSGYSYSESQCQYNKVVENHKRLFNIDTSISTEFQNAYYDSTWALAVSLHNASMVGVNLANYTHGQPSVTETIREQLLKVSFEGLSGKVQFSNKTLDGSEVTIIDIFQRPCNSCEFRLVGYYNRVEGLNLSEDNFLKNSVFDRSFAHPPSALGYVFITLAVVVGLGIGILHCLNSVWGDNIRNLKATSPQLNHMIFSGCYLILLDVVLYSVETTILVEIDSPGAVAFGVLCNAQVWVHSLSFSLVFGTVFVKTWRIFRIFSHFRAKTIKYLGDNILIGFVVCLVCIDTLYLIAWNAIDPLVMFVSNEQPQVYRAICMCDNLTYWICFLVGYKVVLLVLVLYLSISTRHVNRPEFKQTKSINTLIYILVIVNVFGIVPYAIIIASGTTDLFPIIAAYVTLSISYILTAIMCAVFVFLPPIYPVLKKKWKAWWRH